MQQKILNSKEEIIDRLNELEKISAHLELNREEIDVVLSKSQEYTHEFYDRMGEDKAYHKGSPEKGVFKLKPSKNIHALLQHYNDNVEHWGIKPASEGHLGYIPGGGLFLSGVADYIAAITNEYGGMYLGSPGAVEMEHELLNWNKEIFGYPESAVGNLTSGGSIANMIALAAARDKHKIKGEKIEKSVIYLSPHVHHCINKSLRIIGLDDITCNYLELDEQHRIKVDDLKDKIQKDKENGLSPFMVIASAGTTDTGAIDPLHDIGLLAKEHNCWYHIDAAYGGYFILVKDKKPMFKGVELSDSLVVDPHKSLFLPYGIGLVLVKDKESVFNSHHYTANYMQDASVINTINPADVSPELTKHYRALRMWLPLNYHGLEAFEACLEEKLWLTHYFRFRLKELGFQLGPEPDLSVSFFWYPSKGDQDAFNRTLMEKIHEDGRVFLSSSIIDDRFVIRMAILAFRTKKSTIDKAIKMIEECLLGVENGE